MADSLDDALRVYKDSAVKLRPFIREAVDIERVVRAITTAVSDAQKCDYPSAIESLATLISETHTLEGIVEQQVPESVPSREAAEAKTREYEQLLTDFYSKSGDIRSWALGDIIAAFISRCNCRHPG